MTSVSRDSAGKPQIVNVNYFRQASIPLFSYHKLYPRKAMFTRSEVINPLEARCDFCTHGRPSEEYRAGFVDSLSREGDRGPCRARRCHDGVLLRCNRADGETPETVTDSRRHRKQLWDLTRRDCRMCLARFSIKLITLRHKISRVILRHLMCFFFQL